MHFIQASHFRKKKKPQKNKLNRRNVQMCLVKHASSSFIEFDLGTRSTVPLSVCACFMPYYLDFPFFSLLFCVCGYYSGGCWINKQTKCCVVCVSYCTWMHEFIYQHVTIVFGCENNDWMNSIDNCKWVMIVCMRDACLLLLVCVCSSCRVCSSCSLFTVLFLTNWNSLDGKKTMTMDFSL